VASQDLVPRDTATGASSNYYRVILATSFVLLLTSMGFGRYAYPMLLPSMQEGLGVTYGPMGVLGTVNLIGYMVFSLLGGMLAVRYGSKLVITGSMLLVGAAMVGLGLVSAYWVAFVLMVLAGVGTAGVFTPAAGLGRIWSPPGRGGFAMGMLSTGVTAGMVIAAFVIPLVLTSQGQEGWRLSWTYLGIATLLVTTLGVITLKEKPHSASPTGRVGVASAQAWGQVFRSPTIAGLSLTYFLFGFYQIYATFFVAYLRRSLNLPTELVGNIWLYWAVLAFVFMMFWGWLSDRIGRKEAMAPCLMVLLVSVLMPIVWQDIPLLYLSAMIYGATFAGPMTIILAAAGDAVPTSMAAAALGLVTAAFGLGQAVSPAIAGFLTDLTGSFYPGFALSAAVMALSLIVFVRLPLKRHVT